MLNIYVSFCLFYEMIMKYKLTLQIKNNQQIGFLRLLWIGFLVLANLFLHTYVIFFCVCAFVCVYSCYYFGPLEILYNYSTDQ